WAAACRFRRRRGHTPAKAAGLINLLTINIKHRPPLRQASFVRSSYIMTRLALLANVETERNARLRAKLERWFTVTPAMLQSIDEAGRLIGASDAWLAKLGYKREEVIGRLSSDFLTPQSREHAIKNILPEFFRSGRCENVEYQMVAKDGRVIDVLLSSILDDDPSGQGRASLTVVTDVTALKAAERRLAESEARYRGLVEDQSELVSLATPEGQLRYVNDAYARRYGRQRDEVVGKSFFDFIPGEAHAAVAEHLRKVCSADRSIEDENQVILPDGQTRWMSWTNRALRDAEGKVTAIHSVGRDVQQRVVAEQRLKESEARYRLLAEHGTDMVLELDLDLKRRYVSPACREIFGYEPEEMIGGTSGAMAHPEDAPRLAQAFRSLLDGSVDRQSVIARRRHRDGRWIWVETQYRALKDPGTGALTGIIASVRDISARKAVEDRLAEAYQRLEALAREDGLTGLANRRTFDDALSREYKRSLRDNRSLGLIMIDVDCFKTFNDRYGHPAGDECLRRISKTLTHALFRPGDLAARYGGEEFAVLLPDTDEHGAAIIGERIRQAVLHLAIEHDASRRRIMTVSVGAASVSRNAFEGGPEALLQSADRALYRAKGAGRNKVVRASSLRPPSAMPSTAAGPGNQSEISAGSPLSAESQSSAPSTYRSKPAA
ncbi:MAG TPA: PAS domain S-box protein, partial [Roseiarcus sp.]|nr:PAS domain S-box protein [Roseiarcus sp.]